MHTTDPATTAPTHEVPMPVVSLTDTAASLPSPWTPRIVGQVNDQLIKVARIEGSFVWHTHADEDEAFIVLRGHLRIEREGADPVELGPGDLYVVPRGLRHRPVADGECLIALVEPATTAHTGDVETEVTVPVEAQWGRTDR